MDCYVCCRCRTNRRTLPDRSNCRMIRTHRRYSLLSMWYTKVPAKWTSLICKDIKCYKHGRNETHQTIGSNATSTRNTENDLHFPPIEVGRTLGPDCSLLAAQWRSYSNAFRAGNCVWNIIIITKLINISFFFDN